MHLPIEAAAHDLYVPEPGSKTYKECAAPSMGKCNHYTSACTP